MPAVHGSSNVDTEIAAPSGCHVDFDSPTRSTVPAIYLAAGVGCALSLSFLLQRFYTKAFIVRAIHIDDYLLLLAYGAAMAYIGLTLPTFIRVQAGVHAWEIPVESFNTLQLYVYISWPVFILGCSIAKISILAFYLRLSAQKWFRVTTWIVIGCIIAYTACSLADLFRGCKFTDKGWKADTCPAVNMASAIANCVSDLIVFLLPVPVVWNLNIKPAEKVVAISIFAIASATLITSVVRCLYLPTMWSNDDLSWNISAVSLCMTIEANMIIICASLPTVRKFFQSLTPKQFSPISDSSNTKMTRKVYGSQYGSSPYVKPAKGETVIRMCDVDLERNVNINRSEAHTSRSEVSTSQSEEFIIQHPSWGSRPVLR